ncbi:MAG: hypothetical protein HYZ27_12010 [Deltaproteobacteria bacterium]|nr:hypothetical protein [Deltaproteobacteria bacterium]
MILRSCAVLLLAAGCETSDLGKPCGSEPSALGDPVVEGESAVVEVVRVERDVNCESFQCLSHRGLHPYCTESCELDEPPHSPKSCTSDGQCTGGMFANNVQGHCLGGRCQCVKDSECVEPLHCFDGVCLDDDCPKGFWCKRVQDVGPLANELFCTFKAGCIENTDCEELGTIECRHLGCFDACLCDALPEAQAQDLGCADMCTDDTRPEPFHRLHCAPLDDVCACEDQNDTLRCAEASLRCPTDVSQPEWDDGAVARIGYCIPKGY